jgi:xanthine dehydrogenase accessory factor
MSANACERSSPPLDIWRHSRNWLMESRTIALATVIDTWGSSPVPIGGQMVIVDDETFLGSVSGGCVESEVILSGVDAINTGAFERLRFGVADETAWAAGLPCGGQIEILVEPLSGTEGLERVETVIAARSTRRPLLVTVDLGNGEPSLYLDGRAVEPRLAEFYRSGRSGILSLGGSEVFAHVFLPCARLAIVGATHIAQALVTISDVVGLSPFIIDPRESFASAKRFGDTPITNAWPKEAFAGLDLDPFTAVIALAHIERIDDEALSCALKSPVRYIGALGSTRNHARRQKRLAEAGFSSQDLARIRCPVGIDIGAISPEEIALAIAAEVVLAFRGPKRRPHES